VVTHGHGLDTAIMERLAPLTGLAYLGMIGSRKKAARLMQHLKKSGVAANVLRHIRAPIGLETGGNTPAEIALSILAELQSTRHKTPLFAREPES
jgi:xanthine dehydrogenase accessory factor